MVEVLVGRIQGVIDLERAATLSEIAVDLDVSAEQTGYGISGGRCGIDPDATVGCYSIRAAFGYHPETAANTVHAGAVRRCAVDCVTCCWLVVGAIAAPLPEIAGVRLLTHTVMANATSFILTNR